MSVRIHKKSCILVLAGDFTMREIPVLRDDHTILMAADGGIHYLLEMGLEPDYCIGDYDSISEKDKVWLKGFEERYPDHCKTLPVMKDDTDALAAIRWCISMGITEFDIFGALGGRLDHSYANIQLLKFLKNRGCNGRLYNADGSEIIYCMKGGDFRQVTGNGLLSIFSYTEKSTVTLDGLKYNGEKLEVSNDFPIGVSNEKMGEIGSIQVFDGEIIVMEQIC